MGKSLDEVQQQFKDEIFIPETRPLRQFFFCPVGLVGAGKTTITKPIAKHFGLVRVSSDEFRKLLKKNGHSYEKLRPRLKEVAKELIKEGYSIAFDMDCGNPETKGFIEQASEERNIPIFWVHIDTPEEFIFEKFKKHPPSWLTSDPQKMIDNYKAQKKLRAKQNTHFDFIYTFDTSRGDVNQQIQ